MKKTMKTETTFAAAETIAPKQAWTEPTLTTLSLPLETHLMGSMGGDGGATTAVQLT